MSIWKIYPCLSFCCKIKCEKTPGKMMLCSKKDEESLFINYYKAVTILWYRRDVIEKVKYQFWPLDKKLRMVSQAKLFLRYNPSIISCRRPLKRTLFKIPLQAPAVRNGVYSPSEEDSAELPEAGPHLDPPDHGEPPQVLLFTGCSLVIRPQVALQLSRVEGFVRRNKMRHLSCYSKLF